MECRVARPSPPPLLPRASPVMRLCRRALEPVRCAGCAAGRSLPSPGASPTPLGPAGIPAVLGCNLICECSKASTKTRAFRARVPCYVRPAGWPWGPAARVWDRGQRYGGPHTYGELPPRGCPLASAGSGSVLLILISVPRHGPLPPRPPSGAGRLARPASLRSDPPHPAAPSSVPISFFEPVRCSGQAPVLRRGQEESEDQCHLERCFTPRAGL